MRKYPKCVPNQVLAEVSVNLNLCSERICTFKGSLTSLKNGLQPFSEDGKTWSSLESTLPLLDFITEPALTMERHRLVPVQKITVWHRPTRPIMDNIVCRPDGKTEEKVEKICTL